MEMKLLEQDMKHTALVCALKGKFAVFCKRHCSLGCGSFSPSANQRLVITPRGDLITRYHLTSHLSLEPSLISTTTVVP